MTLSQIIAQALFQLDEDAEDVSEYEERFRVMRTWATTSRFANT